MVINTWRQLSNPRTTIPSPTTAKSYNSMPNTSTTLCRLVVLAMYTFNDRVLAYPLHLPVLKFRSFCLHFTTKVSKLQTLWIHFFMKTLAGTILSKKSNYPTSLWTPTPPSLEAQNAFLYTQWLHFDLICLKTSEDKTLIDSRGRLFAKSKSDQWHSMLKWGFQSLRTSEAFQANVGMSRIGKRYFRNKSAAVLISLMSIAGDSFDSHLA